MRGSALSVLALGLLLSLSVSSVAASNDDDVDDSDVIVLTADNFDEIVNSAELMLVEFYAPWCGHCKHLKPEYAKAATALKAIDPPVLLGKVDATEHSALGSRFGVSGYPTLFVFRNGKETKYTGPRQADGIISYMKKQVGPSARPVTSAKEIEALLSGYSSSVIVGFFDKGSKSALSSSFTLTANKLREKFVFARAEGAAELAKEFGVTGEGIVVVRKFDEGNALYSGSTKTSALEEFIYEKAIPLVGEHTSATADLYRERGLPIAKFFSAYDWETNAKQTKYWHNRLAKVAAEFRDKILVVFAKSSENRDVMSQMNMQGTGLIIEQGGNKHLFDKPFNVENLRAFFHSFVKGEAPLFVKSEPIPSSQGPVTTVVGKTFDKIVNDPTKNVFIEFYAPWCGHCKSLAPKFEKLGEAFQGDDSVVIAKIDATANDFDTVKFPVSGYPTLMFVPAEANAKPIPYDGAREVKDMKKWIKKQAKKYKQEL